MVSIPALRGYNTSAGDTYWISYAAILDCVEETILSSQCIHDFVAKKCQFPCKIKEALFHREITNSLPLGFVARLHLLPIKTSEWVNVIF